LAGIDVLLLSRVNRALQKVKVEPPEPIVTALLVIDVEMVQNQNVADGLSMRSPFP
jgi:hypothetical protein